MNVRFLNIVANENAEYVIRMGGDQILADTNFINYILCDMKNKKRNGSMKTVQPVYYQILSAFNI